MKILIEVNLPDEILAQEFPNDPEMVEFKTAISQAKVDLTQGLPKGCEVKITIEETV